MKMKYSVLVGIIFFISGVLISSASEAQSLRDRCVNWLSHVVMGPAQVEKEVPLGPSKDQTLVENLIDELPMSSIGYLLAEEGYVLVKDNRGGRFANNLHLKLNMKTEDRPLSVSLTVRAPLALFLGEEYEVVSPGVIQSALNKTLRLLDQKNIYAEVKEWSKTEILNSRYISGEVETYHLSLIIDQNDEAILKAHLLLLQKLAEEIRKDEKSNAYTSKEKLEEKRGQRTGGGGGIYY